ncbi:MAG TPA: hypothetical protein VHQ70_03070 [Syntrophomonadaceae bacterium]|nr:hypothetical protein [Syntrophomonadaceae bacterium]
MLAATVLFALVLSTDGFMVGVAYGIRKIRMPLLSSLIIFMNSVLVVCHLCFRVQSY